MVYIIISIWQFLIGVVELLNHSEWWRLNWAIALIFVGLALISKQINNVKKYIIEK